MANWEPVKFPSFSNHDVEVLLTNSSEGPAQTSSFLSALIEITGNFVL